MTQVDALADALTATSVHTADGASTASASTVPNLKTTKPSFASALRTGQNATPTILTRDAAAPVTSSSSSSTPPASADIVSAAIPASSSSSLSSSPCELVPVDGTILQAIRKRDDRIFFSQYENQMAALVRDPTRTSLELGVMNAYQRLLVHRCADQFRLEHRFDRATNCITLSKTATTSHPSALLSIRAREFLVQRDGIDPVNVNPAAANLAAPSTTDTSASSPGSSASASSPASPAPAPTAVLSPSSNAPKPGFQIMRRDPSKSRQSPLRSTDNDSNDLDKAAAKARKDMTLEEREASYKAARARIFGDVATSNSSGSASPTSSTPPPDASKTIDQATDAASSTRDTKGASPSTSAASSLAASPVAGRSASRTKKTSSSSSSVATQDGSAQKGRAKTRGKAATTHSTSDSVNDDLEFSRTLPISSHSASPAAFGAPQQSSPLAQPGQVAQGYFPPKQHPSLLQQSQSNPNLRSRAPAFHPQGSSTPAYSQGGGLRHPAEVAAPPQQQRLWPQSGEVVQNDAFPALGSTGANPSQRHAHAQHIGRNAQNSSGGGAWNGPAVGPDHQMNGVGVWAQQVQINAAFRPPQQQQHTQAYLAYPHQQQQQQHPHPQHQHFQAAFLPYPSGQPSFPMHYAPMGQPQAHAYAPSNYTAPRSTTSSRASSQRGGAQNARDDAASVSSMTASSRSASFSGPSGAGSTNATQQANGGGTSTGNSNGTNSKPTTALSHPSLPARPAWLPSSGSAAPSAASGAESSG
ncbi:conserved hypothetical protein [Sporisorium reilianum SRZ2]|uniref:SUZ domain-containing protein n=1 Tax=Sporisorium reilianum (strain SRZ2) TaxID=999809 RepID=E6ZMD0_SPORE|nr:conserved hypothetical protein [Sporisorium reilianum SRZ2]